MESTKIYNPGLKPCPFCGSEVFITRDALWDGDHGYYNNYEFYVKCDECGATKNFKENNTIYYGTEIELQKSVMEQWNQRPDEDE